MKARYLPIEVVRTMIPTGVKGKRDEDLAMSYHGVAYIDMAHLLYPGATRIKGAFKIQPYSDQEYSSKTKRKLGLVDETLKQINNMYDRNFAIMPIKKDSKQVEKKDTKKNPRESNAEGHDLSQSVQQILESKSFLVIDIKFDKPLIARKPFDILARQVQLSFLFPLIFTGARNKEFNRPFQKLLKWVPFCRSWQADSKYVIFSKPTFHLANNGTFRFLPRHIPNESLNTKPVISHI